MMHKVLIVASIFATIVGAGHTHSSYSQDVEATLCHLEKTKDVGFVSTNASIGPTQDPQPNPPQQPAPAQPKPKPENDPDYQPRDTESHRYSPGDGCSRPNPGAEPGTKINGIKKNTVGCVCKKTCNNGQSQEDLNRGVNKKYICKNACHFDRCFCPDPCKT